jgi:transcriptional regulator with XRE-family HTH domain
MRIDGGRLKEARLDLGLSQQALAREAGLHQVDVSCLERNASRRGRAYRADTRAALARALHVSGRWLCGQPGAGRDEPSDTAGHAPPDPMAPVTLPVALVLAVRRALWRLADPLPTARAREILEVIREVLEDVQGDLAARPAGLRPPTPDPAVRQEPSDPPEASPAIRRPRRSDAPAVRLSALEAARRAELPPIDGAATPDGRKARIQAALDLMGGHRAKAALLLGTSLSMFSREAIACGIFRRSAPEELRLTPGEVALRGQLPPIKGARTSRAFKVREAERIRTALELVGWHRMKAALLLEMPRRTFYRKAIAYGIITSSSPVARSPAVPRQHTGRKAS